MNNLKLCFSWEGSNLFNSAFKVSNINIQIPNSQFNVTGRLKCSSDEKNVQNILIFVGEQGVVTSSISCSPINACAIKISAQLFQEICLNNDALRIIKDGKTVEPYVYKTQRQVHFPIQITRDIPLEPNGYYEIRIKNHDSRLTATISKIEYQKPIPCNYVQDYAERVPDSFLKTTPEDWVFES